MAILCLSTAKECRFFSWLVIALEGTKIRPPAEFLDEIQYLRIARSMSGIGFQPVEVENDRLEAYPTAKINSKDPREEFELIFDPNLSESSSSVVRPRLTRQYAGYAQQQSSSMVGTIAQ